MKLQVVLIRTFLSIFLIISLQNLFAQKSAKTGSIQDVLDRYFDLGKALCNSDLKKALEKAKKLENEIVKNNFNPYFEPNTSALKSATDFEKLRFSHYQFSKKLRQILPFSETLDDVVFVIHCPIVFQDSGAFWLSEDKSIHNPYAGNGNKNCGKVIETIKPMVK
jgi:hypothetical protein